MNTDPHSSPETDALNASGVFDLLSEKSVIVCLGPGGIGKTTVSAALAVAAAIKGLRACVITIDPARRLADALGIEGVDNEPKSIKGDWSGKLDAVMLDASATFNELIKRYAKDEQQASEILQNPLYINLTSSLSGTQEYMAGEKLFAIYNSGDYDLIVVDTPPSRHAIDFLDAPDHLFSFLDNKIFRLITNQNRYLKAVSVATQLLLRTIAKVAGAEIVEDAVSFFRAFDGMEDGFRQRAAAITQLFTSDDSAFILISAPQRESVHDTKFFSAALQKRSYKIDALVLNKLLPDFDSMYQKVLANTSESSLATDLSADGFSGNSRAEAEISSLDDSNDKVALSRDLLPDPARPEEGVNASETAELLAWSSHLQNIKELASASAQQSRIVDELLVATPVVNVFKIALLENDVHDLKALQTIADGLLTKRLPLSHG